jgi:hypothetical protein
MYVGPVEVANTQARRASKKCEISNIVLTINAIFLQMYHLMILYKLQIHQYYSNFLSDLTHFLPDMCRSDKVCGDCDSKYEMTSYVVKSYFMSYMYHGLQKRSDFVYFV